MRFPVSRGLFAAATLCAAISFVEAAPVDCVEDSSDGRALKAAALHFYRSAKLPERALAHWKCEGIPA